jgi:hypothetical protein
MNEMSLFVDRFVPGGFFSLKSPIAIDVICCFMITSLVLLAFHISQRFLADKSGQVVTSGDRRCAFSEMRCEKGEFTSHVFPGKASESLYGVLALSVHSGAL